MCPCLAALTGHLATHLWGTLNMDLESRSLGSMTLFKGSFGCAVLAASACAMGAAVCLSPLPVCVSRKVKSQTEKI